MQAMLNLIRKSGVPTAFIEAKQARAAERGGRNYFESDSEEDDEQDVEMELSSRNRAKAMKSNNAFKMLSGIVDPARRVLSAAAPVYFSKNYDGTIELVCILCFDACSGLPDTGHGNAACIVRLKLR
jgi:hypothetical protein